MTMEEKKCVRCGEKIPNGSEYCPTCGAALDGTPYNRVEMFYMDKSRYGLRKDTLGITPKLILIYGILAAILGVVSLAIYGSIESRWSDMADAEGLVYGMTLTQTQTALLFISAGMLLNGMCAVIGGFLADKRARFTVCLALCAIATVAPLIMAVGLTAMIVWAIILLMIGFLITNRVYINKDLFQS